MHYACMQTHSGIVKRAGPAEQVANARGVSVHTVRSWIKRDSIPAEHWAGFVADGKASLEELAEAAARAKLIEYPKRRARKVAIRDNTQSNKPKGVAA